MPSPYILTITVREKGEDIATMCVYVTSTDSHSLSETAADKAAGFIKFIGFKKNKHLDHRLACIRYCEQEHGRIDSGATYNGVSELDYVRSLFPSEAFNYKRFHGGGLVCLSPGGMQHCHEISDFEITIDLDTRMVENYAIWSYPSLDAYNKWCSKHDNTFVPVTEADLSSRLATTVIDIENYAFDDAWEVHSLIPNSCAIESCGRIFEPVL